MLLLYLLEQYLLRLSRLQISVRIGCLSCRIRSLPFILELVPLSLKLVAQHSVFFLWRDLLITDLFDLSNVVNV